MGHPRDRGRRRGRAVRRDLRAGSRGLPTATWTFPSWVNNGSADAARQILIGIAAAVITVVGLVFSITIVALTLASTQFGPRMLRNFIRDRGTQVTLGTFVADVRVRDPRARIGVDTATEATSSRTCASRSPCSSCWSISGVLIYFIHHVASSIQLPQVIASIAHDLSVAIDVGGRRTAAAATVVLATPGRRSRAADAASTTKGAVVRASSSGYLQFVAYATLVDIAARADGVIQLLYRPGPLRRRRPPTRTRLAGGGGCRRCPERSNNRTRPARTGRCRRTSPSRSTRWSRSPSARCRRP